MRGSERRDTVRGSERRYAVRTAACICAIAFVGVGMWQNCPGIFFQPVADSLGIGRGEFSVYLSVQNITNMLVLMVAGKVLARVPFRPLLTGAGLLAGGSFMAMSLYHSRWQFYLTGVVLGAALTFCGAMIAPVLVNNWFRARVGTITGLVLACSSLGGATFNLILSRVIETAGWRVGYLCLGGIGILILVPVAALFIRFTPEQAGRRPFGAQEAPSGRPQQAGELPGLRAGEAVRTPSFYLAFLFVIGVVFMGNVTLSIPAYANSLGFSPTLGGTAASLMLVGGMVCKLLLGWLNDKVGVMRAVAFASLAGVAGILLLAWGVSAAVFLGGAVLLGFGYSLSTVQPPIVTKTLFGLRDYSTVYSYMTAAVFLTGAIASPLYNTIYDRSGTYLPALWFAIAVTVAGYVFLAGALRFGRGLQGRGAAAQAQASAE